MAVQPAWLTPQVQPQQAASPLTQPNPQQAAQATATGGGQVPPYVNLNDPVQAAVWQSFQKKGITPRDQGDFQYWVDNINKTGGFADAGNKQYWLDRMSQQSGGAGDYGQGGGAGAGSPSGGPGGFSFDPNSLASNPTLKFITQQGINAIGANKAAQGTVLGTGTGKDYIDYAQGAASQFEPIAYDQAQRTFQTNFGDLSQLYGTGFDALRQGADYNTSAATAGATGTIGATSAINRGIGDFGNAYLNAKLYSQFNPAAYGAS